MVRIWAKIIKDNEIVKSYVYEKKDVVFDVHHLAIYLMDICGEMDIETPVILSKHIKQYYYFNSTKFLKGDFISEQNFDSLVIENAIID
jgi:hypothetical protein